MSVSHLLICLALLFLSNTGSIGEEACVALQKIHTREHWGGWLPSSDVHLDANADPPWVRSSPENLSVLVPHVTLMCRWVSHASHASVNQIGGKKHILKEDVFMCSDRKLNFRFLML
jgi:hypothetical protein